MSHVERTPQPEAAAAPGGPQSILEAEPVVPARQPRPRLTADGRLRTGRLAGLTMGAAIWTITWPVLLDSLLNSFVGLTDTVLAAAISEAATDAIGAASYILWFIGLVVTALDVGATALVSRSIGAGRGAVANAAVGQTLLLGLAVGATLAAAIAASARPLSMLMTAGAESATAFTTYLLILAASVPFMAIVFAAIACLRGAGDAVRPLAAMAIVNVVNIVVSWILSGVDFTRTAFVDGRPVPRVVLENPFDFDLGVAGIAAGTLIAHVVGAMLMLAMLVRGSHGLRLLRRRLRPHWHTMRRLLRVGIPNFAETFGLWVGNYLVILMVVALGAEGLIGAHILAVRIEAFSFLPGFAMGTAAATLVGQYLGAGSPRLARRSLLVSTTAACLVMGLMGVLFITIPERLVGLLSAQPAHLEQTPTLLFLVGIVQVPFAISIVLRSGMRGAGDVRTVAILTWTSTYAVRLPLAYAFSGVDIAVPGWLGGGVIENPFPFDGGLAGLWVGLCLELVVRAVLFGGRFIHGGWAGQRV